jgi:hypothetical protein
VGSIFICEIGGTNYSLSTSVFPAKKNVSSCVMNYQFSLSFLKNHHVDVSHIPLG